MGGVRLTGATAIGANFTNADLTSLVDLTDADLTKANLTAAALDQSVLTRTNLTGANLTNTDLTLADLTGATLTGANLTNAIWRDTTCPNGTKTDTGCGNGTSNSAQTLSGYNFHWEATWIRTWYDPAHHEWYDYSGRLPQNPTFSFDKAGGDYVSSYVRDETGDHFRITVNSNSSGEMDYIFQLTAPMRVAGLRGPYVVLQPMGFGDILPDPGNPGWYLEGDSAKVGDTLDPGLYLLSTSWIGWFGVRQNRDHQPRPRPGVTRAPRSWIPAPAPARERRNLRTVSAPRA